VSVGTAITPTRRQRTRQLVSANRDLPCGPRAGLGWPVLAPPGDVSGPSGGETKEDDDTAEAPGDDALAEAGVPGAAAPCGPADPASRLFGMPGPSPAPLPPARSPEPPPSACPPLTAPVPPSASPGFVTDRLRTTFAPRIGEPGQRACRAYRGTSRSTYAPLFSSATIAAARVNRGGRGHTLALQNGLGTYNHLLGSRHGAFASKPARSSRSRLPRRTTGKIKHITALSVTGP
jgi:hypothetical protein